MTLLTIVRRHLRERRLASILTALSVALGVAVASAILTLRAQIQRGFDQSAFGYEFIVGPRGSALQLVLNTVFHLDTSPGNIPWSVLDEVRGMPSVALAVPFAVGDSYEGFRVVGTTEDFLTTFEYAPGRQFQLASGERFRWSEERLRHAFEPADGHSHEGPCSEGPFDAVLGAEVARRTALGTGSTFRPTHGTGGSINEDHHDETWTVRGVLRPTGTASDRAIFINLDSFYHIRGHQGGATEPEISAIIVKLRHSQAALRFQEALGRRKDVMAVVPARVVGDLFETLLRIHAVLLANALLVILVAAVSITVALYNAMSGRRRSIAIMRALGARRATVLSVILLEALALCLIGSLAGLLLGHGLVAATAGFLTEASGVAVSAVHLEPVELLLVLGATLFGCAAGIVPALSAYRTDISEGLSGTP